MSRSKRGHDTLKGCHRSFKKIKRLSSSRMRVRSHALCRDILKGRDVQQHEFPVEKGCFDMWDVRW